MLVLSKEHKAKYKVLLEQDVAHALQTLLQEVEAQHLRQVKSGLEDRDIHALAGKIELLRNLKTFEQAIKKDG